MSKGSQHTEMKEYLTVAEAAAYLRVAPATLRKWVFYKMVPFRKHGARVIFSKRDLDLWSESRRTEAGCQERILSSLPEHIRLRIVGGHD